jgi:chorismate lyase / 3-hydroxybenzoate synthase
MNTAPSMAAREAASAASLQLDYLSLQDLASRPEAWWQGVLGIVGFEKPPQIGRFPFPVTASMTRSLTTSDLCEVWRVGGPEVQLSTGEAQHTNVRYRYSEDLLFGSLTVAEQVGKNGEAQALVAATERAYQEIFELLERTEHSHLIRIWNYLPEINRETGGDERYRHFNSARQMAFSNSGRTIAGTVPAASALGSPAGSPISIYFLAAREAPKMIENPRQTSAYHYPPKFGRHRPIFSRACEWGGPKDSKLFISGTASIVGYESIHRGDVAAQTRETMTNIRALLDEANRVVGANRYSLEGLKLKVYVRRPADLPIIESTLLQTLSPQAGIVYLQADVCREDLLVEIEAVCEANEIPYTLNKLPGNGKTR